MEVPREQVLGVWKLSLTDERALAHAEEALLRGELPEALRTLRALAARRPEDPRAQEELGFALVLANQDEEATEVLEARLASPAQLRGAARLAQVLERRGGATARSRPSPR
ncbi:MAG: hypothetical protein R3F62_19680 [Planctomycetota bacterium]